MIRFFDEMPMSSGDLGIGPQTFFNLKFSQMSVLTQYAQLRACLAASKNLVVVGIWCDKVQMY